MSFWGKSFGQSFHKHDSHRDNMKSDDKVSNVCSTSIRLKIYRVTISCLTWVCDGEKKRNTPVINGFERKENKKKL